MYINFDTYNRKGLTEVEIFTLCAIKNKAVEYLYENFSKVQEKLEKDGYIKYVKGKKDSKLEELVRLDKKGEKVLKDLSSSASITEENKKLSEWVINFYKTKKGGIVKNKTETARRCEWFSNETGWVEKKLAILLMLFINDTYDQNSGLSLSEYKEQNPRMVLSNLCDNIFWSPSNNFARHYKLDESPLYQYYLDNQKYVEEQWENRGVEV